MTDPKEARSWFLFDTNISYLDTRKYNFTNFRFQINYFLKTNGTIT